MKWYRLLNSEDGLTLVELIIVMALSLLLMAAVYMTFELQHTSGQTQEVIAATQEDLRAAMETISWDIMHAGITTNASQASDASLSQGIPTNSSDASTLRLVMNPPSGAEDTLYRVVNNDLQRVNMLTNDVQILAHNVTNLTFVYFGQQLVGGVLTRTQVDPAPGTKLTAEQAQTVRFIEVRIVKDSDQNDPNTGARVQRAIERTICRRNGATNLVE